MGISFIDSTPIVVCHDLRIQQYKVFAGLAQRGKRSIGWFYGFRLHLAVNDREELLNLTLTPGDVDDHKPIPKLVIELFGRLFGDKGYLSQSPFEFLLDTFGVRLNTKLRSSMKNRMMPFSEYLLLRKRSIIETIIMPGKNPAFACQTQTHYYLVHLTLVPMYPYSLTRSDDWGMT